MSATRSSSGRILSTTTRAALIYGAATGLLLVAWAVLVDAWWLQPLNLTTFWWTLPGVFLFALAALGRRPMLMVALALPAGVWVWSYGAVFLPTDAAPVEAELRVATFNTYVASEGIGHVEALVEDTEPDILVLQEVFPERESHLRERFAGRYPHVVAIQSRGVGGVMVLSRFPVADIHDVGPPDAADRATAVVELDVDGRRLQVVPIHLTSPCPTCGSDVSDRLESEGVRRQAEVAAILRALRPGVPVIVAGDFNSNERSGPYRRLTRAGFEDPHRERGSGPGFTWPNDAPVPPFIRIDWVMSRQLVPVDAWVDDGSVSDHRPVVVDLAFLGGGDAA